MNTDHDLFQLSETEQLTIRRALRRYAAAIEAEAATIEAAGDGGPHSAAWTAELHQVRHILGMLAPEPGTFDVPE